MKQTAHLYCSFLLALVTLVCGVQRQFRIPVDGKQVTQKECLLAGAAHRFSFAITTLEADHRYILGLVKRQIKYILKKKKKESIISLFVKLQRQPVSKREHACNLEINDSHSINDRLLILRRTAACLGVSTHKNLLFYLRSAVCSLESISRLSGNSSSQPNQRDVLRRRWRSKVMRDQSNFDVRDFLILKDVNEALGKILGRIRRKM